MTLTRNPAASYQSQAVQTAPGPQLLIMLFDRLATDIAVADQAVEARDFCQTNEVLQHAQEIVRVLRFSLQPDGFDGGHDLLALYDFLMQLLVEANLAKDQGKIRECGQIVAPLRDAWYRAVNNPEQADAPARMG
jgi:flagellar secretion chaperone FliS